MSRHSVNINHKNLEFEVSPFDNNGEINEDNIPSHVEDIHNKTEENIINILFIITLSNIWTLILVILPVVIEIGSDNLYYKQEYPLLPYFSFFFSFLLILNYIY